MMLPRTDLCITRLSRALFLALALALAVGFSTPVSAETGEGSSTQTGGTVRLSDSECAITVRSGEMHFGEWKWSGTEYRLESGSASAGVAYRIDGPRSGHCQITVQTAGLVDTDESSDALIGPEHFAVQMVDTDLNPQIIGLGNDGTVSVPWARQRVNTTSVSIVLMTLPNDVPPGVYEGEIIFTISNAP